jgi:hypothetical protein
MDPCDPVEIAVIFLRYPSNAAPEWQARSLRGRSRELVVACPLEGLVRRFPVVSFVKIMSMHRIDLNPVLLIVRSASYQ